MIEVDAHNTAVAKAKIEISLSRLGQLFNSFDPSPFHERDLDQDAEEYIIGSAEEMPRHRPLCWWPICQRISYRTRPLRILERQSITTLPTAQKVSGGGCACYFATVVSL